MYIYILSNIYIPVWKASYGFQGADCLPGTEMTVPNLPDPPTPPNASLPFHSSLLHVSLFPLSQEET